VQVDAGLTRVGVEPGKLPGLVELIERLPGLALEGVFAHFSHGDVPGHETVERQLAVFHGAADPVKKARGDVLLHLQNSGGALHLGEAGLDMVRVGIALYGLQPSTEEPFAGLRPMARVTAPMLAIHDRPAGTGVGYGHTFVTQRASRLAVVPVGYADGYPRQLSNRCVAQVRGRDVPVVGRVSMDQIMVDVTEIQGAEEGEEVTVIAWEPEKANGLDRMADALGTIGYELATHLGGRLKRVVVE
jgi:alanine racemase